MFPGTRAVLGLGSLRSFLELHIGWVTTGNAPSEVTIAWNGQQKQVFSAQGPGCVVWSFHAPADLSPGSQAPADAVLQVELVRGEGALDFVGGGPASSVTR